MFRVILLLSMIFVLPACARVELASHVVKQLPVPESQRSKGRFKVGKPYRIAGQQYTPKETYSFTQTGVASWYGPNFHGKKTANGEIFDKYELTAAHKTLQMPSLVRVTNLENGRSLVVRINDRGPFSKGRIIDLSERAAELLDFKQKGVAKVKVQVLEDESRKLAQIARGGGDTRGLEIAHNTQTPPTPRTTPQIRQPYPQPTTQIASIENEHIFVQAGSFGDKNNAKALASRLQGYGEPSISPTTINGNRYYRVRLGPLQSVPQADQLLAQIVSADIGQPILVVE